jgi:hypothetical protein
MGVDSINVLPRAAANPFSTKGVSRDDQGVARYDELPESLLEMLRRHADTMPDAEAVVELDGDCRPPTARS